MNFTTIVNIFLPRILLHIKFYLLAETSKNGQHIEKIHHGIACDGCKENPIQGKRFKCIECLDFDLCHNCKHSGIHDNHQMELIKVNGKLLRIFYQL